MLFSIVVPCYNVEEYIGKCIESILMQTYRDFELILVDDGSTDKTSEIIKYYAEKDNRIKSIYKENGGLTSARKAGTEFAIGEYIVPIDGDDWIDNNYLKYFKNKIEKCYPDILSCGQIKAGNVMKEIFPEKINGRYGFFIKEELEKYLYLDLFAFNPNLCSKVIKRSIYSKYQILLDNKVSMGEDSAILYPCLVEANSLYIIDKCLYYYRFNPNSMTNQRKKIRSWDNAILRIEHLKNCLPKEKYNFEVQLSCAAVHSITNVIISHLRNGKYSDIKNEFKIKIDSPEIKKFIEQAKESKNIKERIAAYALKIHCFLAFKIASLIL